MDLLSVYNKLPIQLQNAACFYEGYKIKKNRFGKTFHAYLAEYEERKNWDPYMLLAFRDKKIRQMIKHCYQTVPYYRRMFDMLKIDYRDIKTLEDLSILPILNKEVVRQCPSDFLSDALPPQSLIRCHTSGTTGSGFVFYTTQSAVCEQWAVWWRYRKALGIYYGMQCAVFGSKLVVPIEQKKPPYWRYNRPNNQIYFSGFHESEKNLYSYYEEICKHKIEWIHGFPSLITPLAKFMVEKKIEFPHKIKFVTIGAENLLESQKKIIETAFGVVPRQHYGLAEGVANFSEDINGTLYIDEDFSAVEFLKSDIPGEMHIIGTNLSNYAMPLLRWDTGDLATVKEHRNKIREIISIDGRNEDYIILPNGTKVGKLDHAFKDTIHFSEVQIYQHKNYDITIYAVPITDSVFEDQEIAYSLLRQSLGNSININFQYVDRLKREKGKKLRFVISEIEKGRNR